MIFPYLLCEPLHTHTHSPFSSFLHSFLFHSTGFPLSFSLSSHKPSFPLYNPKPDIEMRGPVIGKYPSSDGNGEVGAGNGIIKHNRKCRDIVFLVFFIAFWISMIVNSSFGFNQGNPLR